MYNASISWSSPFCSHNYKNDETGTMFNIVCYRHEFRNNEVTQVNEIKI